MDTRADQLKRQIHELRTAIQRYARTDPSGWQAMRACRQISELQLQLEWRERPKTSLASQRERLEREIRWLEGEALSWGPEDRPELFDELDQLREELAELVP